MYNIIKQVFSLKGTTLLLTPEDGCRPHGTTCLTAGCDVIMKVFISIEAANELKLLMRVLAERSSGSYCDN